jgi:hypothetical protein
MVKKLVSMSCLFLLGFVASAKADSLHGVCFPACGSNGSGLVTSTDPLLSMRREGSGLVLLQSPVLFSDASTSNPWRYQGTLTAIPEWL